MARNEIDLAIEWAAREGWNPGLYDADCYFAADPDGFMTGVLSGKPIATLSAVKYGETFGFLGFYIVSPEFRGLGPLFADTAAIAESLMLALKSKVGAADSVFLDVPAVNNDAVELAERYNMKVMFETARMYNRGIPDLPVKRIYGVTSFEVG